MKFPVRIFKSRAAEPLPPLRSTSDIMTDIDVQVGRLSKVRDDALALLERVEQNASG